MRYTRELVACVTIGAMAVLSGCSRNFGNGDVIIFKAGDSPITVVSSSLKIRATKGWTKCGHPSVNSYCTPELTPKVVSAIDITDASDKVVVARFFVTNVPWSINVEPQGANITSDGTSVTADPVAGTWTPKAATDADGPGADHSDSRTPTSITITVNAVPYPFTCNCKLKLRLH
jgi:hypothetical protein